jgi:vacuolar-type H+-ATPase subunit F/Vma7
MCVRRQDTVTGFLLAGIGHRDARNQANFLVVDPESE